MRPFLTIGNKLRDAPIKCHQLAVLLLCQRQQIGVGRLPMTDKGQRREWTARRDRDFSRPKRMSRQVLTTPLLAPLYGKIASTPRQPS
jgi:hypothetical protein